MGQIQDGDPRMQVAMTVWGNLTVTEQANVFSGVYARVLAYQEREDVKHLKILYDDLCEMVLLESQPGFTESRRTVPPRPNPEPIGIREVIRRLRAG